MKHDVLKWAALGFALVATASAEYELARAVGYNQWVAAAVPGALDVWTVRAMRQHRDVLLAVAAMVAVNALSHLVTAGLMPVNVPLVVGVSAIAPLVLYRVHHISRVPAAVPAPDTTGTGVPGAVPAAAGVASSLGDATPANGDSPSTSTLADLRESPGPGYVLPAGQQTDTQGEKTVADLRPVDGYVDEPIGYALAEPDEPDEYAVPDPAEAVFLESADDLAMDAAADFSNMLTEGEYPSIRVLRDTYSIGQVRAQRIQASLRALAEMGGEQS